MAGMTTLVIGLVLLLGIHSVSIVSDGGRDRIVARIGLGAWRVLYSVASLVGLYLVIHGYALARAEPHVLYTPPYWLRHVALLLMLPVFPLFFAAYFKGHISDRMKHPMLVAVKLWATAHLLANGTLADVVLFGALLAWAVFDRISFKRRTPRPTPSAGRRPTNDAIAIVAGLLVYVMFVGGLHARLIGVPVLP